MRDKVKILINFYLLGMYTAGEVWVEMRKIDNLTSEEEDYFLSTVYPR